MAGQGEAAASSASNPLDSSARKQSILRKLAAEHWDLQVAKAEAKERKIVSLYELSFGPACQHRKLQSQLGLAAKLILSAAASTQRSPTSSTYFPNVHKIMEDLHKRSDDLWLVSTSDEWHKKTMRQHIFGPESKVMHKCLRAFLLDLGVKEDEEGRALAAFCMESCPLLQSSFLELLAREGATGVRLLITQCGLGDMLLNCQKGKGKYSSFSVSSCTRPSPLHFPPPLFPSAI